MLLAAVRKHHKALPSTASLSMHQKMTPLGAVMASELGSIENIHQLLHGSPVLPMKRNGNNWARGTAAFEYVH